MLFHPFMVKHGSMAQCACSLIVDLPAVAKNEFKYPLASPCAFEEHSGASCRIVCDNGLCSAVWACDPHSLDGRFADFGHAVHANPPNTAPAMRCFSSVDWLFGRAYFACRIDRRLRSALFLMVCRSIALYPMIFDIS